MAQTASLRLSDGGLPIDWGGIPFFRPGFLLFDFLAQPQFGAIWCNLVQSGAIPRRELQSGWVELHLLSSKLHLMASRLRLGTEMGRLFDPQVSL
jgi:hypothetical protein